MKKQTDSTAMSFFTLVILVLGCCCSLDTVKAFRSTGVDGGFFQVRTTTDVTKRRWGHCSTYCSGLDKMVVFGGKRDLDDWFSLADLQVFEFHSYTWGAPTLISKAEPAPRTSCAMHTIESTSTSCKIVLLGGKEGIQYLGEENFLDAWVGTITLDSLIPSPTTSPTSSPISEEGSTLSPSTSPTQFPTMSPTHPSVNGTSATKPPETVPPSVPDGNSTDSNNTESEFIGRVRKPVSVSWEELGISTVVTSRPLERSRFCSAQQGSSIYIYGGFSMNNDEVYGDLWRLRISTTTGHGSWILLSLGGIAPTLPTPAARCTLSATSAMDVPNVIVLYGGEIDENAGMLDTSNQSDEDDSKLQLRQSNQMWYFSTQSNRWLSGPRVSHNENSFARLHAQTTVKGDNLIMYGGMVSTQDGFDLTSDSPKVVVSSIFTTKISVMSNAHSTLCDPDQLQGNRVWCAYNQRGNSGWMDGKAGHSCVMRGEDEWVCFGGFGYNSKTGGIIAMSADIIFINISDFLIRDPANLIVSYEDYDQLQVLFILLYVMFGLVVTSVVVVTFTTIRARAAYLAMQDAAPFTVNRGARKSMIERLPLVLYQDPKESDRPTLMSMSLSDNDHDVCPICLCDFEHMDHLRQLPCRHLFHPGCIGEWLPFNKSCPMCKQDIDIDFEDLKTSQTSFYAESDNPLVSNVHGGRLNEIEMELAALRESINSRRFSSTAASDGSPLSDFASFGDLNITSDSSSVSTSTGASSSWKTSLKRLVVKLTGKSDEDQLASFVQP